MQNVLKEVSLQELQGRFPRTAYAIGPAGVSLSVPTEDLLAVLYVLKTDMVFSFDHLAALTAVDYRTHFEMVYPLFSTEKHHWLTVKVQLPHAAPVVDSLTALWPGADFEEREVYDLMGISFRQHPHLQRILLPDGYPGHPLRKDFIAPETYLEGGMLKWKRPNPIS